MVKIKEDYSFYEHENFVEKIRERSVRNKILLVESLCVLLNVVCCVTSSYLALTDFSIMAMAVSIDSLLDIFAHLTVIWRYRRTNELNSCNRDTRACIILAVVFFASSFLIEFESIRNLTFRIKPKQSYMFIFLSLFQSFAFNALCVCTFVLSQKINKNSTLISSGINSLVSGLSTLSMAVSMSIYTMNPKVWYTDSIFGLIMGIMVFIYGCQLLVMNTCFRNEWINHPSHGLIYTIIYINITQIRFYW